MSSSKASYLTWYSDLFGDGFAESYGVAIQCEFGFGHPFGENVIFSVRFDFGHYFTDLACVEVVAREPETQFIA